MLKVWLQRTVALAGQARSNGIRIYSKNANGDCREACNDIPTHDISSAYLSGDRGSLNRFQPALGTHLCIQVSSVPETAGSLVQVFHSGFFG
jgi:hypothetical protein